MSFNQGNSLLISERFFLGGPRSLRGYKIASVSPMFREDDGDLTPIGGNKDALFTLEYIVPLSLEMGMKAVVFYDLGNAWNDNQAMNLNGMLADWGFGIRWLSPMGPLRFELAFPLDQRPSDDPQQFIFTVGSSF
jgi:outer membrane protein insertion porin family